MVQVYISREFLGYACGDWNKIQEKGRFGSMATKVLRTILRVAITRNKVTINEGLLSIKTRILSGAKKQQQQQQQLLFQHDGD